MDEYDSGSAADPMDQDHQQDHFAPVAGSQSPVSPIGSLGGSLDGMLDNLENLGDDGISLDVDENGNVVLNPTDWTGAGGAAAGGGGGSGSGSGGSSTGGAAEAAAGGGADSSGGAGVAAGGAAASSGAEAAPNTNSGTSSWHKVDKNAKVPRPVVSSHDARGRRPKSYDSERWSCPPLFRPVRIPSDPASNADGVSLGELLGGEYTDALVASYLVDAEFLLNAAPRLKTVPFLLIQGIKEDKPLVVSMKAFLKREHPAAVVYLPKTIHIGLHHSKMILLKYKTGVRVVIMTCNMRPDDWEGRCQAAWYQDFPFKPPRAKSKGKEKARGKAGKRKRVGADAAPILDEEPEEEEEEEGGDVGKKKRRGESGVAAADDAGGAGSGGKRKRVDSDSEEDYPEEEEEEEEEEGEGDDDDVVITSEFEEILIDYFEHVGGPAAVWGRSLSAYDFSSANVTLIPSVPGRHKGKDLYRYGHMRVRAVLAREEVHVRPGSHRVAFQAASIMNLSRRPYKWLGEITESFMSEKTSSKDGKGGKKAVRDIDVGLAEEEEMRRKKKEQDERNKGKNQPKKPLGQRKDPWGDKGILEKRKERADRREAIHRRNVLGILPPKKPKPPKRLGKKALKRKKKEEREAAEAAALIKWVGKERKRNWFMKFLRVVWPTEEAVRTSNLGWESGAGMPCLTTTLYEGGYRKCETNYQLNRVMEELKPLLCTWTGAKGMNRGNAMPHLNTYYRYRELPRTDGSLKMSKDGLAYFLLASHSLHRIAWGYLEHRNPPQRPRKRRVRMKPIYPPKPDNTLPYKEEEAQLDIKSFDMGVMFLPSKIPPKRPLPMDYDSDDSDDDMGMGAAGGGGSGAASPAPFSCDPEGALFRLRPLSYRCPDQAPAARLKTLPLGLLPLPHQLPAPPYEYSRTYGYRVVDRPWVWNRNLAKPDIFGKTIQLAKEKK